MATANTALSTVSLARRSSVVISTANPNRDGTGVIASLFAAPSQFPSRIDAIQIAANGTTTAGMIRLYVGGVLLDEITVPANTPTATTKTWIQIYIPPTPILLTQSEVLQVSTERAESFNVTAFGWNY